MPKSRNRQKSKSGRYQLEPQRRSRSRKSPRWYGPLVLSLMGVGVVLIVWNYTRGTNASNTILLSGLGLIAVGFFGTTFWK
jgi:drug/metabolite transporter (DMT)-like permease